MGDEITPADSPTSELEPISEAKARKLVKKMREGFIGGMRAMLQIRDTEAWRAVGYRSFEAFMADEIGVSRQTAYAMVDQAEITLELEAARPAELSSARDSSKAPSRRQAGRLRRDPDLKNAAMALAASGADPADAASGAIADAGPILEVQSRAAVESDKRGGDSTDDVAKRQPEFDSDPDVALESPCTSDSSTTSEGEESRAEHVCRWPVDPQKAMFDAFDAVLDQHGPDKTEKLVRTFDKRIANARPIAPTLAEVHPSRCPHPRAKEDKKTYGVWCGDCGRKIR